LEIDAQEKMKHCKLNVERIAKIYKNVRAPNVIEKKTLRDFKRAMEAENQVRTLMVMKLVKPCWIAAYCYFQMNIDLY
jgi:hypothetical protein